MLVKIIAIIILIIIVIMIVLNFNNQENFVIQPTNYLNQLPFYSTLNNTLGKYFPSSKPIIPNAGVTGLNGPTGISNLNTPTADNITEFISNINTIRSAYKSKPLTWNNNISPQSISKVNSCLYNKNPITYNGTTLGQIIYKGNTTDISTVISKFAVNSTDLGILTNPTCNYTVCLFS
jgi:hypothetical protein